jgi:serine/threonine protein kinase
MNAPDSPAGGESSIAEARQIVEAGEAFEAAWHLGPPVSIEDALARANDLSPGKLFDELLGREIRLRQEAGQKPAIVDYAPRFPNFIQRIEAIFSNVATVSFVSTSDDRPGAQDRNAPPTPLLPDRYNVIRWLGGGGFGDVYLADDGVMRRKVAIKVPNARFVDTKRAQEAFLREARSVAGLQHENIVRAIDFGQGPDASCYIVLEYVEGMSLKDRLEQGALSTREAVLIAAQVADALHYALLHQRLVHRDIKPANILLDKNGKPRVTDFGLALREEELAKEKGGYAGTLPYMSPEQVRRNVQYLDGRSDIYSLGVVLYEMLCGQRPFRAESEPELADQILHREAKPLRQIDDSIPRELELVCLKALSKRIPDRYATARDMADDLMSSIPPSTDSQESEMFVDVKEIAKKIASADEDEQCKLLRQLWRSSEPACVHLIFRFLTSPSEGVREQARKTVHALGWGKVSKFAEDLARSNDEPAISAVLDGLAAFEAHPQVVALLDRLVVLLHGDIRTRTILLLERKRLGLELEAIAGLFREIHSPYCIERVLGQGLFSAAYLARAESAELMVVVRVLRSEFVSQPAVRAGFLDLYNKALRVVHENLVLTRETRAFPDQKTYFAVRDYVDGVSLQKVLESGRRFNPQQVMRMLRRLAAALGAVHRNGLCHGGIKPSNIFVNQEGEVVLGDLSLPIKGIGVALERLSYDYRYVAPETFQGGLAVGQQSDFYALGCVAYELACGVPPFIADSYLELATRHIRDAVPHPGHRGSMLGPAGDALLLKLLARSPQDRFAKAEEIERELDRLEASKQAEVPRSDRLLGDVSLAHYREQGQSIMNWDETLITPSASITAPGQNDGPPTQIGNFDILDTQGRGGMGVVYKARDRRLDRIVALKMLSVSLKNLSPDDRSRQHFLTEARTVARLQHPNIVQVYDIGEHNGLPFIALEFVAGGNLDQAIRNDGPKTPRVAAEMLAILARAVHHAHSQGVVHRDLKPANILLTPKGEPKIADFGLARLTDEILGDPAREARVIGTPAFMPPEQARGELGGPAGDVYSLGAILFVMLTGQRPFTGNTIQDLFFVMTSQTAPPPSTLNPVVPQDLDKICRKCLEKSPTDRYSSAAALADDLEDWLRGMPPTGREQESRWWRRFTSLFSR